VTIEQGDFSIPDFLGEPDLDLDRRFAFSY
jgi:hypothetical protein